MGLSNASPVEPVRAGQLLGRASHVFVGQEVAAEVAQRRVAERVAGRAAKLAGTAVGNLSLAGLRQRLTLTWELLGENWMEMGESPGMTIHDRHPPTHPP